MEENTKKRHSILKRRPSVGIESSPTQTFSKFPKKINFSEKKAIKEFTTCEDKRMTIWGDSYEESEKVQTTQSSDSSAKSHMEISSSRVSNVEPLTFSEPDKENINYAALQMDISRISLPAAEKSMERGIPNTIVDMTLVVPVEDKVTYNKKRGKTDQIIDMSLDTEKLVLSPRKQVFYHSDNSKVIIQDKVMMRPSEMADEKVQLSDMSLSLQDNEKQQLKNQEFAVDITVSQLERIPVTNMSLVQNNKQKKRETIAQPFNMDLEDEVAPQAGKPEQPQVPKMSLVKEPHHKKRATIAQPSSMDLEDEMIASPAPKSGIPEQPQVHNVSLVQNNKQKKRETIAQPFSMDLEDEMASKSGKPVSQLEQPQIPKTQQKKRATIAQPFNMDLEDEFLASPAPKSSKFPEKVLFSATKSGSSAMLTNMEVPGSALRMKVFDDQDMSLSDIFSGNTGKNITRKSLYQEEQMDLSMKIGIPEVAGSSKLQIQASDAESAERVMEIPTELKKTRKTIFDQEIQLESPVPPEKPGTEARKTIYNVEMQFESENPPESAGRELEQPTELKKSRKTIFDQEIVPESPAPSINAGKEKSETRKTIFNEEMQVSTPTNPLGRTAVPPQSRKSIYHQQSMDESLGNPPGTAEKSGTASERSVSIVEGPRQKYKARKTTHVQEAMEQSTTSSISVKSKDSRAASKQFLDIEMDCETPVASPDLKRQRMSQSAKKPDFLELTMGQKPGNRTLGLKGMDVSDSTDTTGNFARKLIGSTHNNISKLLTPQRDLPKRKLIKSVLDETEKYFSESLVHESIQELSAKKQPSQEVRKSSLPVPRRTLYQQADMSVSDVSKVEVASKKDARKTVFDLDESMSVTVAQHFLSIKNVPKNSRKTVYGNDEMMDFTAANLEEAASMVQNVEQVQEDQEAQEAKNGKKNRPTIFNATMNLSMEAEIEVEQKEPEKYSGTQETLCSQDVKSTQETVCTQEERYVPNVSYKIFPSQEMEMQQGGIFKEILDTGNCREKLLSQPEEQSSIQVSVIKEVPRMEDTCQIDVGNLGRKTRNSMLLKRREKDPDEDDGKMDFVVTEIPNETFSYGQDVEVAENLWNQEIAQKSMEITVNHEMSRKIPENLEKSWKIPENLEKSTKIPENLEKSSKIPVNHEMSRKLQENLEKSRKMQEKLEMSRKIPENPSKSVEVPKKSTIPDFEMGCSKYVQKPEFVLQSQEELDGFAFLQNSIMIKQEPVEMEADSEEPAKSKRRFRPSNMYDENDIKLTQSFHRKEEKNESQVDKRRTFVVSNEPKPNKSINSTASETECIIISDSDTSVYPQPTNSNQSDSFLGNESNPCVSEEETEEDPRTALDQSEYYRNFIDLTVTNLLSPAISAGSTTFNASSLDSPVNAIQKFQNFCAEVEAKAAVKDLETLQEIEDFVRKLEVPEPQPVVTPQTLAGIFKFRSEDVRRNVENQLRQEEENKEKQFPEIPSHTFLMNNWLKCLDEEIEQMITYPEIEPIFPENRDFVDLLKNKIESEYPHWQLDDCFAVWNGLLTLTDTHMGYFSINIKYDKDVDVDDSSIPIFFKDVSMFVNPAACGKQTAIQTFLRREFRNKLGCLANRFVKPTEPNSRGFKQMETDSLLHLCPSSSKLFEFMDYYHDLVEQTINQVSILYRTVISNEAVIEQDDDGTPVIIKQKCLNGFYEIVEVSIEMSACIEAIDWHYVQVKSLTEYKYEMKPCQMKGMMMIETILWDVERFVNELIK